MHLDEALVTFAKVQLMSERWRVASYQRQLVGHFVLRTVPPLG